jgi:phosphate transport system ATP-binding protein
MQQAARVSEFTGLFWLGELVEFSPMDLIFSRPRQELTEAYITGKMGKNPPISSADFLY